MNTNLPACVMCNFDAMLQLLSGVVEVSLFPFLIEIIIPEIARTPLKTAISPTLDAMDSEEII